MNSPRVLVVDDDESLRRVTAVQLEEEGYQVDVAARAEEALAILARSAQDLVITDLKMPGLSGVQLLKQIRTDYPETLVILVTAFGTVDSAVEAMKLGAYDYLTKPVNPHDLRRVVARSLENVRLREEVHALRRVLNRKSGFENVLGHSKNLLYVLDVTDRAAQSDVTVLIRGETGTGKELIARGIHRNGDRKAKPFVIVNCGAIPKDLLESELFGHLKGAFTGATAHKKGKIEVADGGTVFLDEVGELPLDLQVKLLRVIQEKEIERIGDIAPMKVDVRIVAATHRNLLAMVEAGSFREDLYYRLNVIPIELPPLRERAEDIPELVEYFFSQARAKQGAHELSLSPSVMPYLCAYQWPGNIRELQNLIERLVVLASSSEIGVKDLPEPLCRERPLLGSLPIELPASGISLEHLEKELILQALKRFNGNQTQAARYLDLSRKTLIYRMEKFGLRDQLIDEQQREGPDAEEAQSHNDLAQEE
jgi:two-component system NtrC family response regulator